MSRVRSSSSRTSRLTESSRTRLGRRASRLRVDLDLAGQEAVGGLMAADAVEGVDQEPHGRLGRLGQRQFTFLHGCGRELQGGEDVIPVQVRIVDENFLNAAPGCE